MNEILKYRPSKTRLSAFLITLILVFCTGLQVANAQQDPQYTQYMYNMNVVNPAYAGSKEHLEIGLLYRNQWVGIEGAPRTVTFSAHTPIDEKQGLGLSAISDQAGPVKETNLYADYSYTLNLGGERRLAFGVKAGATFHDVGLLSVDLQEDFDIAFSENVNNTYLNIGAGLLFYTEKYYVGVSIPNFLNSRHLDINGRKFGSETQHYFTTAGYVLDLSSTVKFKPSALIKASFESPASLDLNANFLLYERFELGASYRLDDAVSGLCSVRATDWLQLGFAYDNSLSYLKEPSYEVFVLFDVFFSKKAYRSPRYF